MKVTLKLGVAMALVLAPSAIGAGCGDRDEGASAGTFTGRVANSDAYIALVSDGERVSGYLCDGDSISTWLAPAALDGDTATLEARDGERIGTVTLGPDRASGELDLAGDAHDFDAARASGDAGLYRATAGRGEPSAVAGWIVLADGSQRGAVARSLPLTDRENLKDGAHTGGANAAIEPAPALDPASANVDWGDGLVQVEPITPGVMDPGMDF